MLLLTLIDHGKVHRFVHSIEIGETLHGDEEAEFQDGDAAEDRGFGVSKRE